MIPKGPLSGRRWPGYSFTCETFCWLPSWPVLCLPLYPPPVPGCQLDSQICAHPFLADHCKVNLEFPPPRLYSLLTHVSSIHSSTWPLIKALDLYNLSWMDEHLLGDRARHPKHPFPQGSVSRLLRSSSGLRSHVSPLLTTETAGCHFCWSGPQSGSEWAQMSLE